MSEVVYQLELSLENLKNARDDSKFMEGIEGIVTFEELDRLVLLTNLALERVTKMENNDGR